MCIRDSISSIASFKLFLIAWWWEYCTFSDSSVVSFKSSPWPKYTQYWTIFPKKSSSTIKIFFFFKYVIYYTVLSKYLKKKSGVTGLVSSQTAVKCGHGFGDHFQDVELAQWGLGRDTKWRSCYAQKRLRNAKPGNHLKHFGCSCTSSKLVSQFNEFKLIAYCPLNEFLVVAFIFFYIVWGCQVINERYWTVIGKSSWFVNFHSKATSKWRTDPLTERVTWLTLLSLMRDTYPPLHVV